MIPVRLLRYSPYRRGSRSKAFAARNPSFEIIELLESRILLTGDHLIVDTTPTGSQHDEHSAAIQTLALTTAEAGEWGPVLDWGLQAKHMVLLPTGDVLIWSTGQNASVWDAETNTLAPVPYFFGDLHCAAQVTLGDGRVAVFGGQDGEPHIGIDVTAFFDPFTNTWSSGTVMNFARWYATATTLADGRVLVTSGDDETEARITIPEIYDPVTDAWTLLTGADRSQVLYPEMFVLPDGRIYEAGTKTETWFLDIDGTGNWTEGPENSFGSSGYAESAVMYAPGKILRAGGGDPAFHSAAVIDTNTANPQWRNVEDMEFARRRMNLTILLDGTVMAIGGTGQGDNVNHAVLEGEIWDPGTEQWTTVAAMSEARMYHSTAVLLPDGRVLTGGGEASGRLHGQIYSPPYLFKGPRPTITASPNTAAFGSQFLISTPNAAEITSVSLIRPGAPTHAFDHNQRYVPLSFQRFGDQLQVTAPPDGNTAPPGYYMLVVENGAGVPSVAAWIQINSSDNLAPGSISGRITNSATGTGIAGATVSSTFGSVTTNSNGNYTLADIPAGEVLITVSAPGFATFSQSQQVLPNQTSTLNLGLVAPGQISGVVTSTATGQPIPGAKISYNGGSIIAGADGSFVAAGIPSGSQTVIASKVGFENVQQTVNIPANGSIVLNFSLPTALTAIEGEVREIETGDPIAGAMVMFGNQMVMTNASGFYIFRDVLPGSYEVTVSAANYFGMSQHVMVESGFATTADFNLVMHPTTTTTISATDDALVKISNPTKNYGQLDHIRLKTGTDAYQSYLKFNVDDLEGEVHKATLRLWSYDGTPSNTSIYLVSNNLNTGGAWTESNINWNNAPAIAGTPLASLPGVGTNVFVDFDVTTAISGEGLYSFGLLNASDNSVYFTSSEGLTPPQLIIETFGMNDAPMIMDFTPSSGGAGTVVSIHGMNFSGVSAVHFNGVASSQVAYVSDTEVRALVPTGVTTGPVTVTTANGTATSSTNFTAPSTSPVAPVVVTAQSWLPYVENTGPVQIEPALTVTDADSANLVGATIAIIGGFAAGQDLLAFSSQNGIVGSFNASTGVLTLTGVSSVSNYQSALRSVTFNNTSENPVGGNRIVDMTVSDGALTGRAGRIVTVNPVNDAPVANTDSYTGVRGGSLVANDANGAVAGVNNNGVLVNDTDAEGSPLFATLVAEPASGVLSFNSNGTFTYTHNGNAATSDSFTYRVSDGTTSGNIATVNISIPAGPSAPVLVTAQSWLQYPENSGPMLIEPALTLTDADSPEIVGATILIIDGFALGQDILGFSNQNGIAGSYNSTTGVLTLTGTSSVSNYQAALRSVTFTNSSDNPVGGNRIIDMRVNDGGLTGRAGRIITVNPVNDLPVANSDAYSVVRGGTLTANDANGTVTGTNNNGVLVNDTDAEGNTLSAALVSGPANGTLSLNANGTFTYTHNNSNATSDTFSYRVNDGSVNGNTATVNITVTATPPSVVTANFQDGLSGYTGTTDAHIRSDTPTTNYGTSSRLEFDGSPDKSSLVRWGLSGIPAGSTILSASIRINILDASSSTFEIYGLNRAFNESQVNFQQAANGQSWSGAGGTGAADRGSVVLGSVAAPPTGLITIPLNAAGVSLVQSWLNSPTTNFGLIFQDYGSAASDGVDFSSSETSTVANRPLLTVTYSAPALSAASVPPEQPSGVSLSSAELTPIQAEAANRLLIAASPGARRTMAAALSKLNLAISDLPPGLLGTTTGTTISLDRDAAGFGWFIDATPGDDLEFVRTAGLTDLHLIGSGANSMDLLTVVMHEMEHYLGEGHNDEGLMDESLPAGTRRLPAGGISDAPLVDAVFAELVTTGTTLH